MKTAIIVPLHNEEENIKELLDKILSLNDDYFIIPVNDNSTDRTGEIINQYGKQENIFPVHREKQEGLHAVYVTGIKKAQELNVEGIVTMDGDLSHPPKDIPRLVKAGSYFAVVVGSRYIKNGKTVEWSVIRAIMSWTARFLARLLLGIKVKDCTAGFKYYSIDFLNSIDFNHLSAKGYAFQVEMIYKATKNNFKIKEIPITFQGRKRGSSKMDSKETFRFFKSIVKLSIS
jgi:dolichol-phosphate mannosyltransferase